MLPTMFRLATMSSTHTFRLPSYNNIFKSARPAFASIKYRNLNSSATTNQMAQAVASPPDRPMPDGFQGIPHHVTTELTPVTLESEEVRRKKVVPTTLQQYEKATKIGVGGPMTGEVQSVAEVTTEAAKSINTSSNSAYWQNISLWKDIPEQKFLDYRWQTANTVQGENRLVKFLDAVLPEKLQGEAGSCFEHINTREDFIKDVLDGIAQAPMAIRLTPHTLSVIDWSSPFDDPMRRQFLPMKSSTIADHPMLELDSLHEEGDSKVKGLVHRYPDKALFLATSACPVYCRFCTRSYAIGPETNTVIKNSLKPTKKRWDDMFKYIRSTPTLSDIVVSGGDTYYLTPDQLYDIGEKLIGIEHIRRIRFASKGLAVCPTRIIDPTDSWASALVAVSNLGKSEGKAVALHTHFNHPNEITWVTKKAARRLFREGVTVRNQTVLLKGVNDDVSTMSALIRGLADNNIQPYYVYQGDMVKGVEDLRTPLQTCLDLEEQIRGSIAGFMMPQFVVDLPGGGGKRLAASWRTYDRKTGISTFVSPAIGKGKDTVFTYYDPVNSTKND